MNYLHNTRHKYKKTLCLIGGATEFGQVIATRFSHSHFKKWKVISIDDKPNPKAQKNILIDKSKVISKSVMEGVHREIKDYAEELDTIINISEIDNVDPEVTLGSESVFDEYEKIKSQNVTAGMMTVYMAANFLSPQGYVCFGHNLEALKYENGGIPVGDKKLKNGANCLEVAANKCMLQTAINAATSRAFKDDLLYENSCVNLYLLGLMNSAKNRKKYPSANFTEWLPMEAIAELIKLWSAGDNRPDNGAFVGFRAEGKKGKVVFPEYY